MTTILFKDNKFWIDGVDIINPELLPFYFKDLLGGLWYYTQEHNHPLKNYEAFLPPENLSYEIEDVCPCEYDRMLGSVTQCFICEGKTKKVIRLKLKELKNE